MTRTRRPSGGDAHASSGPAQSSGSAPRSRASPGSSASPRSPRSVSARSPTSTTSRTRRPNIVYELLLGGILTATLVPLYVEHYEKQRPARDGRDQLRRGRGARGRSRVIGFLAAPWIIEIFMRAAARRGQGRAAGARHRPAAVVHAADLLLRRHRARDRDAQRAPTVRRGRVRAGAEQRRRDRGAARAADRRERAADRHQRPRRTRSSSLLLGLGTTAGIVAMALVLFPALRHAGARLHWVWEWRHPAVVHLARLSGWTIGYVATNQVAFWVALFLAYGHRGDASVYIAAFTFFQLPHGLFAVSIMTALAPELASRASRGDYDGLRAQFAMGFRLMGLVVIPAAAILLGARAPDRERAARLRELHRAQRRRDRGDAGVVRDRPLLVLRVPLHAARLLLDAGHHARRSSSTASRTASTSCSRSRSTRCSACRGSRSSWSIAYIVAMVVSLEAMRRRLGRLEGRRMVDTLGRVLIATVVLAALALGRRDRHRVRDPGLGDRRRPSPRSSSAARASSSRCSLLHVSELQPCLRADRECRPPAALGAVRTTRIATVRVTMGAAQIVEGPTPSISGGPVGVRVVTDSSCDLPVARAAELGIEIVPLTIRFGGEEFVDRVELTNEEFWAQGRDLRRAARDRGPVGRRVRVDVPAPRRRGRRRDHLHQPLLPALRHHAVRPSRRKSLEGDVPGRGRRLADGLDGPRPAVHQRGAAWPRTAPTSTQIARATEDQAQRTRLFGALDTLEHLRRGGRIGAAQALLGGMLSIKPVIEVRDGAVAEAGKVRTRSKSLKLLADKVAEAAEPAAGLRVRRAGARHRRDGRAARADRGARSDRVRHDRTGHRHPRRARARSASAGSTVRSPTAIPRVEMLATRPSWARRPG